MISQDFLHKSCSAGKVVFVRLFGACFGCRKPRICSCMKQGVCGDVVFAAGNKGFSVTSFSLQETRGLR